MAHHILQGMIKKPVSRASLGSSKNASKTSTWGSDGKLYNLIDQRDWRKFHVTLTQEEIEEEAKRIRLMEQSIMMRVKPPEPKGTIRGGWERKKGLRPTSAMSATSSSSSSSSSSISHMSTEAPEAKVAKRPASAPQRREPSHQEHDVRSDGIAGATMDAATMQKYYEKNLTALQKVYDEKKTMERKVRSLESSLHRARKGLSTSPAPRRETVSAGKLSATTDDHLLPPPTYDTMENTEEHLETASEGDVPARYRRKFLISEHLIKDQEKFIARKKEWEEREAQKRAERERYEKAVFDRFARASKSGKDFSEMLERSERAKEKFRLKAEAKEQKRLEAERKELEAKKKEIQDQLARASFGNANRSWKELVEEEEIRRKERIEKRKQEISSIVSKIYVPGEGNGKTGANSTKERRKSDPGVSANVDSFRAEDPDRVAKKLNAMRLAWKEKEEQEKERARQREADLLLRKSVPKNPLVASMEKRMEKAEQRKKERERALKEREAEAQRKKAAEEKAKMDRIMKTKFKPEAQKPTKSIQARMNIVKKQMLDEAQAKENEAKMAKIRAQKEKEMSAVIKTIIRESERDRLAKLGKEYIELDKTDKVAKEQAAQAREQFREALRQNKKRIDEFVKNRPSLIQRHDKDMAMKAAGASGLSRAAEAIRSATSGQGGDDYGDDLFEEDEKLVLKMAR